MDQEIRRQNKIPGSCDEFTRPDEITELEKYISQQIKDLDGEINLDEGSDKLTGSGQGYLKEEYPKEYSTITEILKDKPFHSLPNTIQTIDLEKGLIYETYRDDIIGNDIEKATEDFVKVPGKRYEGNVLPDDLTEGNLISHYPKDYPNYESVSLDSNIDSELPNGLQTIWNNDITEPTKDFLHLKDTDKVKKPSRIREDIKGNNISKPTKDFLHLKDTDKVKEPSRIREDIKGNNISKPTKDFLQLKNTDKEIKSSHVREDLKVDQKLETVAGISPDNYLPTDKLDSDSKISRKNVVLDTLHVTEPDYVKEGIVEISDNTSPIISDVVIGLDDTDPLVGLPTYVDQLTDKGEDIDLSEHVDKIDVNTSKIPLQKHKEVLNEVSEDIDLPTKIVRGPKEVADKIPTYREDLSITESIFKSDRVDLEIPKEIIPTSTKELLEPTPNEVGSINPQLVLGPIEEIVEIPEEKVTLEAVEHDFASFLERLTADEAPVNLDRKDTIQAKDEGVVPNHFESLSIGPETLPNKKKVATIPGYQDIEDMPEDVRINVPGEIIDVVPSDFKSLRPEDKGNEWNAEDGFYEDNVTRPGRDPELPRKKSPLKIKDKKIDVSELFDDKVELDKGRDILPKPTLVQRPVDDSTGDDRKEWSEEDGFYEDSITRPGEDKELPSFDKISQKPDDLREDIDEEELPGEFLEELPVFSDEYEAEIDEILNSKNRKDLTLYYTNIIKFAERLSELSNTGYGYKVAGLISTYLGSDNVTKPKIERFERELAAAIVPSLTGEGEGEWEMSKLKETGSNESVELNKRVELPEETNIKNRRSDDKLVMTPHYRLPGFFKAVGGPLGFSLSSFKSILDALLNPNSYIRLLAENTVGLLHGGKLTGLNSITNTAREKALNLTLRALINFRDKLEIKKGKSRMLLPRVKARVVKAGSTIYKVRARDGKVIGKVISKKDKVFGYNKYDMSRPINFPGHPYTNFNLKTIAYKEDGTQDYRKLGETYYLSDSYWSGVGIGTTLADLCDKSPNTEINSVKEFAEILKKSPYTLDSGKITSNQHSQKVMTLDTNYYWEIIFEPYVGSLNGYRSYLPAIEEINNVNYLTHGVRTGYHHWLPINSFELSKSKLNSKSLSLFDGEISYPISMEYTNEFRMNIIDDQFKSFRNYFEKCIEVSTFNSTPHELNWYIPGGTKGKITAVDKNYNLVAPYKNITFRCRVYSMTPQKSTINKYDLLLVLKDFTEERMGEASPSDSELSVSFCIVGENPKSDAVQTASVLTSMKLDPNTSLNMKFPELEGVPMKGAIIGSPAPSPMTSNDIFSQIGPKQPAGEWVPPFPGINRSASNNSILCI